MKKKQLQLGRPIHGLYGSRLLERVEHHINLNLSLNNGCGKYFWSGIITAKKLGHVAHRCSILPQSTYINIVHSGAKNGKDALNFVKC